MPNEKILSGWVKQVPPNFRFTLKAPRRITHDAKLVGCDRPDTNVRTSSLESSISGPVPWADAGRAGNAITSVDTIIKATIRLIQRTT